MDLMLVGGRLMVAGPDTTATFHHAVGDIRGIRLPPGLAPRLLGVPAVELRDSRPWLDQIWPAGRVRQAENVVLGGGRSGLEQLVMRLAQDFVVTGPPTMSWQHRLVSCLGKRTDSSAAARELGWSTRQLHRRCLEAFGYGPSVLSAILRFRRALQLAVAGHPLADAAARAGYADQSHLARATRMLSGVPMTTLLAERSSG